jgi:Cu+-exporting ATPase
MERCPVCGMQIDREDAVERTQYEGKTYYFCSESCQERFELDPERYANAETKRR